VKIIGALLVAWGILDVGLSWIEIDLYQKIGIALSDTIYPYTHWIAIIIGGGVFSLGKDTTDEEI